MSLVTCIRLAVNGHDAAFLLSRESANGWRVVHDNRVLGVVYRVEAGPAESQWRARGRARGPASVAGHPTRMAAIRALYEAML